MNRFYHIAIAVALVMVANLAVANDFYFYRVSKDDHIGFFLQRLGICPIWGPLGYAKEIEDLNPQGFYDGMLIPSAKIRVPKYLVHPDLVEFFSVAQEVNFKFRFQKIPPCYLSNRSKLLAEWVKQQYPKQVEPTEKVYEKFAELSLLVKRSVIQVDGTEIENGRKGKFVAKDGKGAGARLNLQWAKRFSTEIQYSIWGGTFSNAENASIYEAHQQLRDFALQFEFHLALFLALGLSGEKSERVYYVTTGSGLYTFEKMNPLQYEAFLLWSIKIFDPLMLRQKFSYGFIPKYVTTDREFTGGKVFSSETIFKCSLDKWHVSPGINYMNLQVTSENVKYQNQFAELFFMLGRSLP